MSSLSRAAHPFSCEPEEIDVAFSPSGQRGERSGSYDISERTNRWIKVGPQAVIGALETLESGSAVLSISTFPLSLSLAVPYSFLITTYDIVGRVTLAYYGQPGRKSDY